MAEALELFLPRLHARSPGRGSEGEGGPEGGGLAAGRFGSDGRHVAWVPTEHRRLLRLPLDSLLALEVLEERYRALHLADAGRELVPPLPDVLLLLVVAAANRLPRLEVVLPIERGQLRALGAVGPTQRVHYRIVLVIL
eukprot:CAMPEP_0180144476 /NCGR_PEP_ID=MMETSP0986-20121125/16956_1 /TAXON_ID=697907 /ORGANISM="non described non described, Strain CCMP2293" /LENGTH=138 /DNA_ID=CAMNT_0022088387 /DNA_START=165 /DNA_END=581 /DNA_ORIENTATION=-